MHDALKHLASLRPGAAVRYGLPLGVVGVMTLLRYVAPLDVAPFLLYLPVIFLATLALGRRAGAVGLAASTAAAAYFFVRPDRVWRLSPGEIVALGEYLVVGGAMVLICGSLRQAFIEGEGVLARLNQANSYLEASSQHLEVARREAEDARTAAEGANEAKSEFLANMSHELRTPLSAIIGYSEMMLEELDESGDGAGLGADMRKIEGNARHLLGLINDVLDLSKIESGKMDIYAETFSVGAMLEDLSTTVGSLIGKKGNRLDLRLAPDLADMHSDLTKIRQVLLNLLSNAAKFTEGGTITLSAERVADQDGVDRLVFAVADTGLGMTEEQLARLFQRFQQADSSTTRKFGGTGLGLSLTKAFADMLHGSVSVTSKAGQGSRFTFTLPATFSSGTEELGRSGPDGTREAEGGGDLILVIDDDRDQQILITRFLHRAGFRVRVAGNGRMGLDLARKLRPRAILLDVMMPGIDGWSVLSELKAAPDLSDTPVVMVTGVDQRSLADALGAADYMLKPIDWNRFGKVMERFRTSGASGHRVLLVEDDPVIRMAIRASLEDAGWTVVEAGDGAQGLAAAATAGPLQVVLIDLNMPVLDGFDFLAEFRTVPGCAEVPVVVLTGRELTPADRKLLRGGSQVLNRGDLSLATLVERLQLLAGPA